MPYNDELAQRLRQHVKVHGELITEKKMFGGLSFFYKGNDCVACYCGFIVVIALWGSVYYSIIRITIKKRKSFLLKTIRFVILPA